MEDLVTTNDKHIQLQLDAKGMKSMYDELKTFAKSVLTKDLDYAVIPGTTKNSLLKAGAEKLRIAFGLGAEFVRTEYLVTHEPSPSIDVSYVCTITTNSGQIISQCEGNCNSYEDKYRYRYVVSANKPTTEESIKLKAQRLGKWQKQGAEWVWLEKTINTEIFGLKNTIMKMAQKRALVGAILIATGASEFFTQDIEDFPELIPDKSEQIQTDLDKVREELDKVNTIPELTAVKEKFGINDAEMVKLYMDKYQSLTKTEKEVKNGKAKNDR